MSVFVAATRGLANRYVGRLVPGLMDGRESMDLRRIPGDKAARYAILSTLNCGRGSMVELELPKLTTRVRFPSPAPWNPKPRNMFLGFFYGL